LEGWRAASKGLGILPRRRGSTLARGCGRGGREVLPLPRAAAVTTGSRPPIMRYCGDIVETLWRYRGDIGEI
jgi:hypothetical protein